MPVECVMYVGDSGGETIRGHEGVRDAEGRGGANGGEQRAKRETQGAEDDKGDKAMEGDEDASMQRVEGGSGPTAGGSEKKKPRRRAKGAMRQGQRQDAARRRGPD